MTSGRGWTIVGEFGLAGFVVAVAGVGVAAGIVALWQFVAVALTGGVLAVAVSAMVDPAVARSAAARRDRDRARELFGERSVLVSYHCCGEALLCSDGETAGSAESYCPFCQTVGPVTRLSVPRPAALELAEVDRDV